MTTATTTTDLDALDQTMAQQAQQMQNVVGENGLTTEDTLTAARMVEQINDATGQDKSLDDFMDEDGNVDADAIFNEACAANVPMVTAYSYLTRGAKLFCRKGSHVRRLNLPETHGVFTLNCPMTHENDCLPGDLFNIRTFGVCSSELNPNGGTVLLKKVRYDENYEPYEDTGENVKGKPCTPVIVGRWMAPYRKTKIVENVPIGIRDVCSACEKAIKGDTTYHAITTNSFLLCKFGGLIEAWSSGTEYADEDQGNIEEEENTEAPSSNAEAPTDAGASSSGSSEWSSSDAGAPNSNAEAPVNAGASSSTETPSDAEAPGTPPDPSNSGA